MHARLDVYRSWMTEQVTAGPGRFAGMFFEDIIEDTYREIVRPGDLVVDGGANHGMHTLPLSDMVESGGEVLAVEAIPVLADALAERLAAEHRINTRVAKTAIGAAIGSSSFTWSRGDGDGLSGLRERNMPDWARERIEVIDVPVTTLDSLLVGRRKPVRFIKLDLEGGEYDALRGGAAVLREDHPFIIFENGRQYAAGLYGYRREDWFDLFAGLGYTVRDLFGRPFGPAQWDTPDVPWYFIATAAGSADEAFVRERLYDRIALLHLRITTESALTALAQRTAAAEESLARLPSIEHRLEEAETAASTTHRNTSADETLARLPSLEHRLAEAEATASAAQARLLSIEASTTWRASAGLRSWLSRHNGLRSLASWAAQKLSVR